MKIQRAHSVGIARRERLPTEGVLPAVSPFLLRGFRWYIRRFVKRHFNAVRVSKGTAPHLPPDQSVLCFANHPGWWDPLFAFLISDHFFPQRTVYAPIDQRQLDRYPLFNKLGFFGVDQHAPRGARAFLTVANALLARPTTALWMTPGGRFADPRAPVTFQPGLAHLAASTSHVSLLPVAIEYAFWEERTPEALIEFGTPLKSGGLTDKHSWQPLLENALAEVQNRLARKVIARHEEAFDLVATGAAGVGGWYEGFRRLTSFWQREPYHVRHRRAAEEPLL